jgi:NTP pyrophosphatase (non-canonical NTP hydrolase)
MKDKLLQIINHYGIDKQLKYIHSEYYELDEAIINLFNEEYIEYPEIEESHKKHITEEIADVMVMLKQFQYYYGITDKQIEDVMNYKIDRQLERIEKENIDN